LKQGGQITSLMLLYEDEEDDALVQEVVLNRVVNSMQSLLVDQVAVLEKSLAITLLLFVVSVN
jgi:hypothetical protein